jgi:hypothetical protein
MAILDIFIGVPQSKYAAMATVAAIVAVAVAMLAGKTELSMGQKFVAILVMFLFALPGLLLSLFQLTCLVTGTGAGNQKWWCGVYAWIGTIVSFLWALVVITIVVISIKRGTSVEAELAAVEGFSDMKAAAQAARKMADKAAAEYFADGTTMPDMPKDTVPPKTEAEKKAEESMMLAAAAAGATVPAGEMGEMGEMGADMPPPMVPTVIPDGTVSSMPSPGDNIVLPEGFVGAVAMKKGKEGFYAQAAAAAIQPSAPETFTSCGAPLAF